MIRKIKVHNAVGAVLAHDVTRIVPGHFKGPLFSRGHVIASEDIPKLLDIGKEHIYVLELDEGEVHEDEAARRIAAAIAGPGIDLAGPREGKVTLKARYRGLLKVNVPLLTEVNSVPEVIVAAAHDNTLCQPQARVAGTRIIPLFVPEARVREVEDLCAKKGRVVEVIPLPEKKVGVVITGSEVFKGRIEDRFGEVIQKKVEALGSRVLPKLLAPDDVELIAQAIARLKDQGAEIILACGGMSVDPDDVTREGIERTGAQIVKYGVPVLPGSMFLYALWDGIAVLGVPACVIHDPATVLDIVLPRLLAGQTLSAQDFVEMGHGGLCLECGDCRFPLCPFGCS